VKTIRIQINPEPRINNLMKSCELVGGKAALGRLLGYKDGAYVGQMLRGERPITEKTIAQLSEIPKIGNLWELRAIAPAALTGEGSMVVDGASGNSSSLEGFRAKNHTDTIVIPQFETGGAMGNGVLLRDQPGVIQRWIVNAEWIHKNIKSHTGAANLCIVTGFGDSMKGMFNSGDPLVVDKGVKTVEFDAIYFFRVADEGFIKRLQRIPGEGLRVLSENKKYDSWTIKPGMDFEVFGRVVKAWQGEDF